MRKPALLLVFVSAAALAAPTPQTLGARSAHHELRLERSVEAPDRIAYTVTVVDLDSGKTVLSSKIAPGQPLDVTSASGGRQVRVHLVETAHVFTASVNVSEDKKVVDEFRSWWQLEPRETMPAETAATGVNATGAYRVGGDVKAPMLIRRIEPIYTPEARRARISGIVIVETVIDKDGHVKDASVLKPLPFGLDQAAIDAVKQWEFKPGTLNGEPVPVVFILTVNFRLDTAPE